MELSESLSTREPDLLEELRSAADNLKSCSSPEVQNEIETTVEESVVQWNDSRKSLRNLCERYQNAIKIWAVYRKNSDIVNEWVDNQLSSLSSLPAEQAAQQLQIYEEAVNEQTEKLVELRGMVMEIATEVGVKEDNLLADEIALLSRKLEDVRSAISTLNNVTIFDKRKVVNGELAETQKTLESMKQELSSKGDAKPTINAEHIQKLNDHLRALAQTDTLLNNIKEEQAEILTDPDASDKQKISVVNLLESWQQVFKDTFQQYHGLFSSVSGEQNYLEALKLWTDYLHYIQDFLGSSIPDNYHNLNSDDQICQLYENLLLSQSAILLDEKTKRIGSTLGEQFESLNKLHNATLSNVIARHHQVKQRLILWQRYQKDQKELLSFLRSVESEQSHLNLRYIYIRTIDTSLRKIEELLKKIEKGILMADNLSNQHDNLMSGCSQSVVTSVKVELDSNYKRLHNSEAALKTWHEYLFKIKNIAKLYEDIASNFEQIFIKVHEGIDNEVCPTRESTFAIADIRQKIDKLLKYKEEVAALDEEANELTNLEEKLKQSVNPKDMKIVRQRIWLLKQQQIDIKHQLSTLIFQLEEKLALWDTFDKRQQSFMSWANDLNTSLEKFSQNQDYPEVVLRRLENEFCTEVDSKHGEYNWLLTTGECLSKYESHSETEPICGKINNVMDAWKKINDNTKGEVEKVKHIIKESATLRTSIKDIIVWIRELSFTLNTIIFFERFDESALNEKIQEHEALQKEIDQRKTEVSDVLQRCEIFVMDCEHCNVSLDIKSFIVRYDSLDRNWTSLKMECAQCKDRIFVVWKMIQEVLSLCRSEDPWLTEQHDLLTKIQSQCDKVPFSEINSLATKLNSISVAINNHSTQFKLLEESYADLLSKNHIRNLSLVQDILDRYSALKKFVVRLNGRIEDDSLKWKEFLSSHSNLILKLSQLDAKLTQIQHLDDAKAGDTEDANKLKLEKLLALEKEFESYNEPITATNEKAKELMSNKKRPDGKSIQEMMDEYLVMFKDIKKRIKTLKQFYRKTKSIKSQENISEEVQVETLRFEQDFAAQVDTLPTSLQRKDAFYYELQSTKKESQDNIEQLIEASNEDPISENTTKAIACCQSSVDLMKHLSAVLIGQCGMLSDEAVLIEVDELVNKYQLLLSEIRFKQQHHQQQQIENNSELGRLRCPLCSQRNWSQLDNDIWRLEKWLEHAQGTLQANPATPPHNIEQLEDIIQEHKEFMVYLDSHRDVIVSLNIVGKHLMEHSENEEQSVVLQDRLVRVNEKWEKVCTQSLAWQHKLQAALMENEEFHNIIEELLNWIEETENSIKSCEPVDLTEDTSVIKEKYNKFKKLHKALKRCEPRVASLQAANQVCITQQTNELETSQNKLDHLRLRLQSLIRLTWLYMLKLGSVLGYDVKNLYSGMDLSTTSTMTLSQEFLDEHAIEPMDRADTPESTTSNEDENRSILSRGNRFFGRVIRASLPIQAFIFVMLGVVTLFPRVDDEYTCSTANNMAWSLEPMLRYPDGPPPT